MQGPGALAAGHRDCSLAVTVTGCWSRVPLPQLSLGAVKTLAPRLANASFIPRARRSLGLFLRVVRNDVRLGVSRVGVPNLTGH
jgi:hypothetical protein